MRSLGKIAIAALTLGGAALGTSAPANAQVGISLSFGNPGYYGDYDYGRPCWFYRKWSVPAPARCYRDYYGSFGPSVFVVDGFVFRNRDDYGRWHDRDIYVTGRTAAATGTATAMEAGIMAATTTVAGIATDAAAIMVIGIAVITTMVITTAIMDGTMTVATIAVITTMAVTTTITVMTTTS